VSARSCRVSVVVVATCGLLLAQLTLPARAGVELAIAIVLVTAPDQDTAGTWGRRLDDAETGRHRDVLASSHDVMSRSR
jgi:hypothetical protein